MHLKQQILTLALHGPLILYQSDESSFKLWSYQWVELAQVHRNPAAITKQQKVNTTNQQD
jgi:hypothetical protein